LKTVYLAGPITGLDFKGATSWRAYASDRFEAVGVQPLSPMRGKAYLEDKGILQADCNQYGALSALSSNRGIMARDYNDANNCDVLLANLLGATAPSLGTAMELAWAYKEGIPVVAAMEPAGNPHQHGMILEAIDFKVETLDEAIDIALAVLAPPALFFRQEKRREAVEFKGAA
jgi:nucleoside 2-deoxyribosyltransferase